MRKESRRWPFRRVAVRYPSIRSAARQKLGRRSDTPKDAIVSATMRGGRRHPWPGRKGRITIVRLSVGAASVDGVDSNAAVGGSGTVGHGVRPETGCAGSVSAEKGCDDGIDSGIDSGAPHAGAPALLSPVAGGIVRTWSGRWTMLWRVDDAARLRVLTASGWAGRVRHRDGRVRAAGGLERRGGRFRLRLPGLGSRPDAVFGLEPITHTPAHRDSTVLWDELFTYFAIAVDSAMRTGEALFVERGGHVRTGTPECFVAALDDGAGPFVVVEADPVPHGNDVWGRVPDDVAACGIVVPADMSTVTGAGLHMLECVRYWGWAPWDAVLTRRPHPPSAVRKTPDGIVYSRLEPMRPGLTGKR